MRFALVPAERNIFLVNITVVGTEFLEQRTVLDATATDIICKAGKREAVTTVRAVIGTES